MSVPQAPFSHTTQVSTTGRIEVAVPFPPGSAVRVFVVPNDDNEQLSADFLAAAETSMDFWDNPWDDEDWNDALTR